MIKNFFKIEKRINKNTSGGYALLETIFYVILFAVLSLVVINAMVTMTKAFKETAIQSDLMQGSNILEKISRETRQAYAVNTVSTDSLKLNSTENGANKTVEFSLSGSNVRFLQNDAFVDNLNTQNVSVTGLIFSQINTSRGTAIKIVLSLRSNRDVLNRNEDFYNTVVLRGSY